MNGAERPSARVRELIRVAAQAMLEDPDELQAAVDAAVLEATPDQYVADPALAAAIRATNRANLQHWARHNLEHPGERVPPNVGPDTLDIARDIVRRGFDDATLNTYRTGQNAAWRLWMAAAFELTSDPGELRELLDVTAASIFAFVDDTIAGVQAQVDRERRELQHGIHADRLQTVNLVLEGAPITAERAGARLRYAIARRSHRAAILWTEGGRADLEEVAVAAARAAGAGSPFTLVASVNSLWAWFPGDVTVAPPPGVRVALGSLGDGLDGFRASHLEAVATQRLMPADVAVAAYEDVQAVALVDPERAGPFVARVLGELAGDAVLRETLRAYLRAGSSVSATARALFAHRNTVLNRVKRAQELLPRPLEDSRLDVALALELLHWRAPG